MKRKYRYSVTGKGKLMGVQKSPIVQRSSEVVATSHGNAVFQFRRETCLHTLPDHETGGWKNVQVECLGAA